MEPGAEQFGPFAIDPAWRRRGPMAQPGALSAGLQSASAGTTETASLPQNQEPEGALERPTWVSAPVNDDGREAIIPALVTPPRPEEIPALPPFRPDPAPPAPVPRRIRRRRPSAAELAIPYLAAAVGLLALGGAIYLDLQSQQRLGVLTSELASIRARLDAMGAHGATSGTGDNGALDAIMALQNRVAVLEANPAAPMQAPDLASSAETAASDQTASIAGSGSAAQPGADDCIPVDTMFLAIPGENYPICQMAEIIRVREITFDGVVLGSGKVVLVGDQSALQTDGCAVTVLTADGSGFADLKVSCS